MNWGRKKTSTASVPEKGMKPMAKMFPVSWFSRLKQRHGNEKSCVGRNKFHGDAEENFWRLEFGDEGAQERKGSRGYPGSVSNGWNDEIELSPSACRSCGPKCVGGMVGKESVDFSDMVMDLRKAGGLYHQHVEAKREPSEANGNLNELRRDCKLEINLKWADRKMEGGKGVVPGDPNIRNPTVKDIMEVDALKPIKTSIRISRRSPSSSSSSSSQKHHNEASTFSKFQGTECENLSEIKLAGLSLAAACGERKSIYISRESLGRRSKKGRSRKVRIYSPRTPSKAELCKIRALEDLKKARMKMRIKENEVKEKTLPGSFAVVKCSFDPQKDFRNSMLEMILDKGISQPEELEELLACYLILNSDEHHDLIIKVFRQVWFDLNKNPIRGEEQCG